MKQTTSPKRFHLIPFAITIIILLILAGIIFVLFTNDKGFLTKEYNVKTQTELTKEEALSNASTNYGIFNDYYEKASRKLKTLTLDQKINQMLLVSYNNSNTSNAYGGILFFEKDFTGKTESQVQQMIDNLQNTSNIPFLTAVDEEGKTGNKGVIRVSSNRNLTTSNTYLKGNPFPNSQTLYKKRRI